MRARLWSRAVTVLAAFALVGIPASVATASAAAPILHRIATINLGEVALPGLVLVDPSRRIAYTATGGVVMVTNLRTHRTVGVPVTADDYVSHMLLNPTTHELIVLTDTDIVVLAGTRIVSTTALPAGTSFEAPTYDRANGLLYVLVDDSSDSELLVVNGRTIVARYPAGSNLDGAGGPPVVDTATGMVYAPLKPDAEVAVLSGSNLVTRIPVSEDPDLIQVDAKRGIVYDLSISGTLDVIESDTVAATLDPNAPVFDGASETLDPTSGDLYVTDSVSMQAVGVSVYQGTTFLGFVRAPGTVTVLDPTRNLLYVKASAQWVVLHGDTVRRRTDLTGVSSATSNVDAVGGVYDVTDDLVLLNLTHSVAVMRNGKLLQKVKVGKDPSDEGFDRAMRLLVVVNNQASTLSLLHVAKAA
jgi:hypothetical protein